MGAKTGTNGSKDYRYFAGGQLLMRLVSFSIFFQTQDHAYVGYLSMLIHSIVWTLAIILFAPYKRDLYNKFEAFFTFYFSIIFASLYDFMREILWLESYYTEVILYLTMFLPSTIAVIGFSVSICRLCCGCSWMPNNPFFTDTSLDVTTSAAGSNMEDPLLKEGSADGISLSSSDHLYVQDRFAEEIGDATP